VRAPAIAAGCVVIREGARGTEVLLVHARGASFRKPLFGIPKGLVETGESLEEAAQRETQEETGLCVVIRAALGSVRQKSGKIVHAFLADVAPESATAIDEQGRCHGHDHEIDVCRFYPLAEARQAMIEAQRELLDRIGEKTTDDHR
jgi:predicted NUDIX family NTP pyrophosphohydrolase